MLRSAPRAYTLLQAFSTASPTACNIHERLRLLCSRGHLEEAFSLFYSLDAPRPREIYATLFQACAGRQCLRLGLSLHQHMLAHDPKTPPDLYLTNHLINMYAKCGELEYARRLFDEMPQRNVVSWTALISGFARQGKASECFSLFTGMLAHCRPNEFAYASVLSSCGINCGRQMHALALKTAFDDYVYVGNALITMYSNGCGYGVHRDDKDEAWMVFRAMKFRNLVTWNSMIAGFQIHGQGDQAMKFFSVMHLKGIAFDGATLLSILSSLLPDGVSDVSLGLKFCFQLQCLVIKTGFSVDIGVATALVKAYSNLGGNVADYYNIFLETSGSRDIVSWTDMIATFAERDPEKALFLFHQLRQDGLAPDSCTFSSVLKACAGLMSRLSALALHSQIVKSGLKDDVVVANALIHAYARCGLVSLAEQVFFEMGFRDTISWNSMLKAYALHGQATEASELFRQMNVKADANTFVALLSACSHAGLVDEGVNLFDTMFEKYGVVPQLVHFACMVDMLGRAGHILEANKLINNMPMKPDYVVWSAFLGACRKHGEINLARLAATKLKELDPENSLGYVLMYNIYSSSGIFTEGGSMRREMKGLGVQKERGLSWIEVENRVNDFSSGSHQHAQAEAILATMRMTSNCITSVRSLVWFWLYQMQEAYMSMEVLFAL